MARPRSKTSSFTKFTRKRGAFDRFTCSQVNETGKQVLGQSPLSQQSIKPRQAVLQELARQRGYLTKRQEEAINRWALSLGDELIDDTTKFQ